MSPSWTGRGRCPQHIAAELCLPAADTGNRSAGMPSGVLSRRSVGPKGREGWITQARERGLQGPAFCCELEGHLFRGHLRERTPSDVKKHPGALLDFTAALACWIQNCLSLHKGFQLLNWWDGLFFCLVDFFFFLCPNISVSEIVVFHQFGLFLAF